MSRPHVLLENIECPEEKKLRRRSTIGGLVFNLACHVATYYGFVWMFGPSKGFRFFLILFLIALPGHIRWAVVNVRQPKWIQVNRSGIRAALPGWEEWIPWEEVIIEERILWGIFLTIHIIHNDAEIRIFKDYIGYDFLVHLAKEGGVRNNMNPPDSEGPTTAESDDSGAAGE